MTQQLTFDLPSRPAMGREDFFVSPANAVAVAALDRWRDWPLGKMVLTGPEGAGKTHLVQVWAREAGAVTIAAADLACADIPALAEKARVVVEDVTGLAGSRPGEEALFHLHNLLAATGGHLLLTARTPANRWPLVLPDLASRMQGTSMVALNPPDDALLSAVLVKLFADRQIAVQPTLIAYITARMDRSFAAARTLVTRLDARALAERRPLTRALAAAVMEDDTPHPHGLDSGDDTTA